MITSWALKFIPWITIKMKVPPQPIDFEQFLLTSNHISFMDLFFIQVCSFSTRHSLPPSLPLTLLSSLPPYQHTMYQSLSRQAIQRVRLIYWGKLVSIPLVKGILTLPFLHPLFLSYQHTMYQSLSRQAIQRVRLIYWEKLASIPLVKGIFTLTGGVPIKILGSTSLKEGDNKYCKEVRPSLPPSFPPSLPPMIVSSHPLFPPPSLPPQSVKAVYGAVDKAIVDKLSIALSFEGRRNPNPPTLSKIQRGMFKMHQQYDIPVVLIRLRGTFPPSLPPSPPPSARYNEACSKCTSSTIPLWS